MHPALVTFLWVVSALLAVILLIIVWAVVSSLIDWVSELDLPRRRSAPEEPPVYHPEQAMDEES
jgi:hypothetical protein